MRNVFSIITYDPTLHILVYQHSQTIEQLVRMHMHVFFKAHLQPRMCFNDTAEEGRNFLDSYTLHFLAHAKGMNFLPS